MELVTPTQAQPIIQAIIDFYGHDFDRVSEFHQTIYPHLHGTHPLTDAMLDALTEWLVEARFAKYDAPQLHGQQQVINTSTGERHMIDFNEIDFDEL